MAHRSEYERVAQLVEKHDPADFVPTISYGLDVSYIGRVLNGSEIVYVTHCCAHHEEAMVLVTEWLMNARRARLRREAVSSMPSTDW